jgi:hypothetical protein
MDINNQSSSTSSFFGRQEVEPKIEPIIKKFDSFREIKREEDERRDKERPLKSIPIGDDIECNDWLNEVKLPQYGETFITNCSSNAGTRKTREKDFSLGFADSRNLQICNLNKLIASNNAGILSRYRLSKIRLQDFPKMNITNYDHQKVLIEHLRHSLKFAFKSQDRYVRMKIFLSNSSRDCRLFAINNVHLFFNRIAEVERMQSQRDLLSQKYEEDQMNKIKSEQSLKPLRIRRRRRSLNAGNYLRSLRTTLQ